MKTAKTILFLVFLCGITTIASAQIKVDDTKNATELVGILTNNSPCVTPSNETAKGDTFTVGKNSYGSFDKGTSSFPFAKGIVLSTWSAKNSEGTFDSVNSAGGTSSWGGDSDLDTALGITSINATSLEFDIKPSTNFISFNYLFASNEYQNEFPCNYSDGFAFLIKEKNGTNYTNLAVIPGTKTAVSSQNIHPEINSSGNIGGTTYKCDAVNKNFFNGFNTAVSPINYAGQTVVMTAQAKVTPGVTYKIKLVVADNINQYYNSAVFLEAGSFSSIIDLNPDQLLATNHYVCFGKSINLSAIAASGATYRWFKVSSTTQISTNSTCTVTDADTYKVVAVLPTGCLATGEIKIEYAPEIKRNATILQLCDTGGSKFNLTKANTDLIGSNSDITKIEYFDTKSASGSLSGAITNETNYPGNRNNLVYAKLTNKYNCSAEGAEIKLQIVLSTPSLPSSPLPIINDFSGDGNSVELIPPAAGGFYEYSLDGTNYKTSPLFSDLSAGEYTAYIRNSSTCEYLINPFIILDYPRFFTPNNDGYNDTWKIKNLESFPKAILTIFDRYGKLLSQINTINSEWNGKFNGYDLPADDYWFTLNFGVGKITKGHFSLKR